MGSTTDPPTTGRPRVMLVCPVADEIGGAEQVMLAVARGLPALGFDPVLAVMRPGRLAGLARSYGVPAHAFPTVHRYRDVGPAWRAAGWLTDLARRAGAALLHSTHTAHLYAAVAARRAGVPEVWHCHDGPARRDAVDLLQRLLRPDHAIFTTAEVARGFPELRRGPHTTVPPSCVDPAHLRGQPPRPGVRDRLGVPPGPMLLTVARLQEHKGHRDLIDAAASVLRDRPDAAFVVAGRAGTPDQERYRSDLLARCDRLGVGDRVRLVGFVDDADLAELYRQAAALVHPARTEAYGLVLLEAMGMGLPVVAAAAAGPAEIVRDGENGLLVPPRCPAALAAAVLRVLGGDDGVRDRLRAGGRATSERLTLDAMLARTADVYRRTLAARPARG